ncbi:hypothetical protein K402DRAFT_18939 [Aulographum hederae CBS 113979]|uniref:Uncharacterized protein n=1 Tax=Aulographum hederae CBS 113979 TaxID=1176131 RepID=A0A6G1H6Z9_9PEZI|nr:hypothetical protein K402DRAFT_18939 [Aulographum hederae CBS 113979]
MIPPLSEIPPTIPKARASLGNFSTGDKLSRKYVGFLLACFFTRATLVCYLATLFCSNPICSLPYTASFTFFTALLSILEVLWLYPSQQG